VPNDNWALYINSNNKLTLNFWSGGVLRQTVGTASFSTDTWYHVAATYDSGTSTVKLYVNASLDKEDTKTGNLDTNAISVQIGRAPGAAFYGTIAEIRIYKNRALTPVEILQNYNATKWRYDGTGGQPLYSTLAEVPDNNNDLVSFQNGVMPYVEYQKIWVDGVLQQHIEWEYDTTFHDQSGAAVAHDAIPSFRTTSSNANVSAQLVSFSPSTEAKIPTYTLGGELADIIAETPTTPSQMYSEGDYSHIPGADAANALLDAGEVPRALWWYPFIYISIGIIGMLVYGATSLRVSQGRISGDTQGEGSLLAMCIVCEVLLALVGIMNPVPLWPAVLFPIAAGAIIISKKHYSWT